ncbi:MAG: hypothetical protein WEA82_09970 [Idiomarina sp.]
MKIKLGKSSINAVFHGVERYTNKLRGKNITQNGGTLSVDYTHYNQRGTAPTPEQSDAVKLLTRYADIKRFIIYDETIRRTLDWEKLTKVELILNGVGPVSYNVTSVDESNGFIDV